MSHQATISKVKELPTSVLSPALRTLREAYGKLCQEDQKTNHLGSKV